MTDGSVGMGDRILVPLDGSEHAERAIPYAVALAAPEATLVLVRIVASGISDRPRPHDNTANGVDRSTPRTTAERDLALAADKLRRRCPNLRVETAVGIGNPDSEILRIGRERDVDLVVMASQGRNTPNGRVLGSVADQVACKTTLPVMVVPTTAAPTAPEYSAIRRFVVPMDGSDVATRVVAVAGTLAQQCRASIHLLAALDAAYASPIGSALTGHDHALHRDVSANLRAEAETMLERHGARLMCAGQTVWWEIVSAPPADAIVMAVRSGDVIVLIGRGHGGVAHWPVGSVAEKVLRYAPVPVLLLPSMSAAETGTTAHH